MIYFDNNATTKIIPSVFDAMRPFLEETYGNPSSAHQAGNPARVAIEKARNQIAQKLEVTANEITFVGSGSEANTHAIVGGMLTPLDRGRNLVISAVEHPSVKEAARFAAKKFGFELRIAPFVVEGNQVRREPILELIDEDTKVVSMMIANNETGVLLPVAEVFQAAEKFGCLRHCDAAQGLGKIDIRPDALHCDALTLAPHKLHGPKGIGVFYLKRGVKLDPWILGGPQEYGRRAGTENVASIVGTGAAVSAIDGAVHRKLAELRNYFEDQLTAALPKKTKINFRKLARIPNTSSVQFPGQDANLLLIKLDKHQICVSAGSACSSGSLSVSKVLLASGLTEREASCTLRISFSRLNTRAEIDRFIEVLKKIL